MLWYTPPYIDCAVDRIRLMHSCRVIFNLFVHLFIYKIGSLEFHKSKIEAFQLVITQIKLLRPRPAWRKLKLLPLTELWNCQNTHDNYCELRQKAVKWAWLQTNNILVEIGICNHANVRYLLWGRRRFLTRLLFLFNCNKLYYRSKR